MWQFGSRRWISSMRSIASTSPVGFLVNLYAPWLVPIATASASTPVSATNSLGLVRVGQQLIVREDALGPVAVFLLAVARFERAEAAQFALDRNALRVGQLRRPAFVTCTL